MPAASTAASVMNVRLAHKRMTKLQCLLWAEMQVPLRTIPLQKARLPPSCAQAMRHTDSRKPSAGETDVALFETRLAFLVPQIAMLSLGARLDREVKHDGFRTLIRIVGKGVRAITRSARTGSAHQP
jgi:ATP-dependent DNA ligase